MKVKLLLNEWEKELIEDVRKQKVYCVIKKVSPSGMTRKMRFYASSKKDGSLRDITDIIAFVSGYGKDKNDNLNVRGCGMDMIFSVLSNFNYAMARLDTGKSIQELLKTGECGSRIYDDYFFDANHYGHL